jgi:hypothetical protein
MAISKEEVAQNVDSESKIRISHSPRPSGVAGSPPTHPLFNENQNDAGSKPTSGRPSGVEGSKPISSRPSGVARESGSPGQGYNNYTEGSNTSGSLTDEMGYGRIVRVVVATSR